MISKKNGTNNICNYLMIIIKTYNNFIKNNYKKNYNKHKIILIIYKTIL
jgi:hypothetical protein